MNTQYGKLLFINLLTSPGAVPAAVLEAAKGEATPIIEAIQSGGEIVEAAGEVVLTTLKAGAFIAQNIFWILGLGLLLASSNSNIRTKAQKLIK